VFKLTMIPVITSFSPNVGSVGTRITLTGANFTEATAVKFGGINVPNFTINSDTSLSFTVPAPGVASAKILVINPFGKGTSVRAFVMTPVVNSFSPGKGPVGTTVTLKGANFTAATAVMVGTVPASFTVISDTKMTLTVPTSAVTAPISVVNSYGTGVSNRAFMVTH
jgi:ribosomal protein L11